MYKIKTVIAVVLVTYYSVLFTLILMSYSKEERQRGELTLPRRERNFSLCVATSTNLLVLNPGIMSIEII